MPFSPFSFFTSLEVGRVLAKAGAMRKPDGNHIHVDFSGEDE
jgi:hypothetical protein